MLAGQVRPRALPRPRPPAPGGRELRVPDLAGHGGPDQVARRPDLAAVRPHGRGARHPGRHRGLAQRGRGQPGPQHHPPLPRPGAVPGLAGLRQLLPLLHPPAQGGRPREDPDVAVRERLPVPRAAHRDPGRHHVRRRSAAAQRPAARGHPDPAPGHSAPGDHPDREPGALPPARADHARADRHAQAVPPALHQYPFQPPGRADPGRGGRPGPAGRRRHPARLPDRAAQGRQRRPGGHEAS